MLKTDKVVYTEKFIQWLYNIVVGNIYQNLDVNKLDAVIENMLTTSVFNENTKKRFDSVNFFQQLIEEFEIVSRYGVIIFRINPFIREHNTNIPLVKLFNLMSYGCLTFKGYSLFIDVFNNITTNINEYYNEYRSLYM